MAKVTAGNWSAHAPCTNALWLAYLADVVLSLKATGLTAYDKRALRGFRCGSEASLSPHEVMLEKEGFGRRRSVEVMRCPNLIALSESIGPWADPVQSIPKNKAVKNRPMVPCRKRALAAKSCTDLLFDEYFDGAWRSSA